MSIADLIVRKFLDEATTPVAKEVGIGLANIVNLLFTPSEFLRKYKDIQLEHFFNKIHEGLLEIPPENTIPPLLTIAGPALEHVAKFGFNEFDEEHIQDLFAELIVASMDKSKIPHIHPAFVEIIKQLSIYDAMLLNSGYFHLADMDKIFGRKNIPLCDLVYRTKDTKEIVSYIARDFIHPEHTCQLLSSDDFVFCIQNLVRLNLVNIIIDDEILDGFYENYLTDDLLCRYDTIANLEPGIIKKKLSLTEFGFEFVKICTKR